MVVSAERQYRTKRQGDVVDLTHDVASAVDSCGFANGLAIVFVTGSTAAVTTMEFEPGVVADLDRALEGVAPRRAEYQHHLRWGDDNGSGHVRAAILGPSLTIPFIERKLVLGTWQQVVLVELDTRGRTRDVVIQMIGE